MSHIFDSYAPVKEGSVGERRNGVLISQDDGAAVAYALWKLQDRGRMFVKPGDALYEGMIIGIHSRDNDLVVNPIKGKQLTNVRASGTDEAVRLVPPIQMSLEYAVEFIDDDELVEVTPQSIRLRKRHLKEHERRRASREGRVSLSLALALPRKESRKAASGRLFCVLPTAPRKTLLRVLSKSGPFVAKARRDGLRGCDIVTFVGAYCDMLRARKF